MHHDIIWTQPPPVWPGLSVKFVPERAAALQQPVILRFASDGFMDDFMQLLATEPRRLGEFRARPETWRGFTPAPTTRPVPPGAGVLRHLRLIRRHGQADTIKPGTKVAAVTAAANPRLKLYQPAHQRYYLVTSSLVCRVPGLPDRAVDRGRDERAGFVLRRLLPPVANPTSTDVASWEEHAWMPGPAGPAWRRLPANGERALVAGEELLPMFGVQCDELGRSGRRLLAGVIPTGRREAYLGAPKATGAAAAGVTARTARKILLRSDFIEPWKSIVARARQVKSSFIPSVADGEKSPTAAQRIDRLKIEREQVQTASWLLLLDLARYLAQYANSVWLAILDPNRAAHLLPPQQNLFAALEATVCAEPLRESIRHRWFADGAKSELYAATAVPATLRAALALYGAPAGGLNAELESLLEGQDVPYDRDDAVKRNAWPHFLFPLADADDPGNAPLPPALDLGPLTAEDQDELKLDEDPVANDPLERIDRLAVLIVRALEDDGAPEPAVPTAAITPADALRGWFRIRCVYDRPGCEPLHGAVVSEACETFEIAGFFDPDAPARPIRIGLPIDTTPAGLRRFNKNTAFVISSTLCGQIRRVKGMTFGDLVRSVLPWPFHKDLSVGEGGPCKTGNGVDLGMICSLSIPIITLCALILLIIIVTLLDIIFRWLPYFIVCFPVPGLGGKNKSAAPS
jgi:hypothetical protein